MKKKVLVIVAHPDDETIWMGGTLLRNKNRWNTEIISLCRKDDKDRAPRFKEACRIFNAKGFMSDLEDDKLTEISTNEAIKRIKEYANKEYDYIFTHGNNGEYGHIRHKDANKAVKEMLKNKILMCKKIFFFSYIKKGCICYANENSDKFINLKDIELERKKMLIRGVYGFLKDSFEDLCSRDTEAFNTEGSL